MAFNYCSAIVKLFNLFSIYSRNFLRCTECLVVSRLANISEVIDTCLHTIQQFSFQGRSVCNQRIGVVIARQPEGVSLKAYIKNRWASLTVAALLKLFLQVAKGLSHLHSQNISHQNLHPDAVNVAVNGGKGEDVCTLHDFLFLHTPRTIGTMHAKNAMDSSTTSPSREDSTCSSDILALGACILSWASAGLPSYQVACNASRNQQQSHTLSTSWGPWLYRLTTLCLEPNEALRLKAPEVVVFLSATLANILKSERVRGESMRCTTGVAN